MSNTSLVKNRYSMAAELLTWKGRLENYIDQRDRILLPAPAIFVVVTMLMFPVIFTLYMSFHEWSGGVRPPDFVRLKNYSELFSDTRFRMSLLRTGYFVLMSVGSQLVLGMLAALVFHRPFTGRGVARTLFLFPMIATPSAMALVWKMMLDPTIGSLSYVIQKIGLPQPTFVADARTVIPTLVMVDTWQWTPLVMLIILAGLAALPVEPYEAAEVDGASSWQTFFFLTLPLLRPTFIVATMFRMIDAIKTFDIIMVITGGGPGYSSEILNIYAFSQSLTYFHFGYGSTLLVTLAVLVFVVAMIFNRFRRSGFWM